MIDRLQTKEIKAPGVQGLLHFQAVTAVQVKVFSSDLDSFE